MVGNRPVRRYEAAQRTRLADQQAEMSELRAECDALADTAWGVSEEVRALSIELAEVRAERDALRARLSELDAWGGER